MRADRPAVSADDEPANPVALVTGASSGIGAATATRLQADGYRVHALARRAERLEALAAATGCITHALDVRDHGQLTELAQSVGPVDVLVNNAGLARMDAPLHNSSVEDLVTTIDTNVTSAMVAARAVLPAMIERGRGHIVNIGSMAGLYPLAAASYGASKGAIHLLSLNLRLELAGTGVRVTEINPGRVSTEFYDVAVSDPVRRTDMKDSGVDEVTADEVADAIMYAIGVPRHVNINRIELQPTEQTYGGSSFDRVDWSRQ